MPRPEKKAQPKKLTTRMWREIARRTRDRQWHFMERVAEHGRLWFCVWNKARRPEAPDEWRDGLISGMEILDWIGRRKSWFVYGEWDEGRYARPVQLTDAGRRALKRRDRRADMAPVYGGLVEPGWQAIPLPPEASPAAA